MTELTKTNLINIMKLSFIKEENNRWYAILPDWEGDKEELEMVMGADVMLDILSGYSDYVELMLDVDDFVGNTFKLQFLKDESDGGVYFLNMSGMTEDFELWLCHVTKFVFNGDLPKTLYGKVI